VRRKERSLIKTTKRLIEISGIISLQAEIEIISSPRRGQTVIKKGGVSTTPEGNRRGGSQVRLKGRRSSCRFLMNLGLLNPDKLSSEGEKPAWATKKVYLNL